MAQNGTEPRGTEQRWQSLARTSSEPQRISIDPNGCAVAEHGFELTGDGMAAQGSELSCKGIAGHGIVEMRIATAKPGYEAHSDGGAEFCSGWQWNCVERQGKGTA